MASAGAGSTRTPVGTGACGAGVDARACARRPHTRQRLLFAGAHDAHWMRGSQSILWTVTLLCGGGGAAAWRCGRSRSTCDDSSTAGRTTTWGRSSAPRCAHTYTHRTHTHTHTSCTLARTHTHTHNVRVWTGTPSAPRCGAMRDVGGHRDTNPRVIERRDTSPRVIEHRDTSPRVCVGALLCAVSESSVAVSVVAPTIGTPLTFARLKGCGGSGSIGSGAYDLYTPDLRTPERVRR
jgi:hypothetical protein